MFHRPRRTTPAPATPVARVALVWLTVLASAGVAACSSTPSTPDAAMGASAPIRAADPSPGDASGDSTWLPDLDASNDEAPVERGPAGGSGASQTERGQRVTGDGYALVAPGGWVDNTDEVDEPDAPVDTAMAGHEVDGVLENLTVTTLEHDSLEAYENAAPTDLAWMSRDVEVADRLRIDGLPAAHVVAMANTGDADFVFEQYAVLRGDTVYALSFTLSAERSPSEREALVTEVLATWQWQDSDRGDR